MSEHKTGDGTPASAAGHAMEGLDGALQELVLESADVHEFLTELTTLASAGLSREGNRVVCGITAIRRNRPVTAASSGPRARALDEMQNGFGDGPCLSALRTKTVIHVPDLDREQRWPEYVRCAAAEGIGSILAVPLDLAGEAEAVMNLYSSGAQGFSPDGVTAARSFASRASASLRLALRIAQLSDARDDLTAALKSRTVIDMATGAIMAQNRCSRDTAFGLLTRASSNRNAKLRDVAASVIASIAGEENISTHFKI